MMKELVDKKYQELLQEHPNWNPIQMSDALTNYCYNDIGISYNALWDYINEITGFYEY